MELKLLAIKAPNKVYVTDNTKLSSYNNSYLKSYYFDGEKPKETFDKDWLELQNLPKIIERDMSRESINYRYELIDPSLESDKIPLILKRDDITHIDYDGCREWKDEYIHLKSLYVEKCDFLEARKENIDFSIDVAFETDEDIAPPKPFNYKAIRKWDFSDKEYELNRNDITHQVLDRIVYPSLWMHKLPSKLSSKQVYDILRQYIKTNIDPRYAKITSDYNFCFTVEKNLLISDPYTKEITTGTGRRKKTNKTLINQRHIQVFEMTSEEEKYKGYTPIKGIVGDDEEDLQNKLNNLIEETIAKINAPLIDCPRCEGTGVILEDSQ